MQEFAEALGTKKVKEYRTEMLPPIVQGAGDADPEVRRWAFGALNLLAHMRIWTTLSPDGKAYGKTMPKGLEAEPSLRPKIIAAIRDPNPEIREYAVAALSLGYPASKETEDALLTLLADEKERRVRRSIAAGLGAGKYNSKPATDALLGLLRDPSEEIRVGAAEFLAERKVKEALPVIAGELKSDSSYARRGSAKALGEYGPAASQYLEALETAAAAEKDDATRRQIRAAISEIKKEKKK